ncbi:MAG: LacI family DNA-binding transcriptional regulator [Solirubrobacteraceae bacterium]
MTTLRDVAAAAEVSVGTASNVFSRPELVSDSARERVRAAARKLGYAGPDPAARRLRTGTAGAIGLVFTYTLEFAFADAAAVAFLRGLAGGLHERQSGLLIVPTTRSEVLQSGEGGEGVVRDALVDGFVVYSAPDRDPRVKAAIARALPTVIVDQPRDLNRLPFVGIDDHAGAQAAAEHVRRLGHRHTAIVSFGPSADDAGQQPFPLTAERLAGYRAGLGPLADTTPVYICRPNAIEHAENLAREVLSRADRPTAVLAMSDAIALGFRRVAAELDIAVPDDLSIVGFDDSPLAALSDPPLTTVAQPLEDKGRVAAERLLAALAHRRRVRRRTILPVELRVRGTTAAPPGLSARA